MNHTNHLHNTQPGLFDLWNPWILLITLAIGFAYFYLIGPAGSSIKGHAPVTGLKKFLFVSGLLFFWGAEGTPIAYYGHAHMFSSHMLAQSMLYLIVPPLIYLGLPDWLVRSVLGGKWAKRLIYPLTQPLIAIFSFNLLFSIYHIPMVFDFAYEAQWAHYLFHSVLLLVAFQMWFPVFSPLPEWNRLSDLQRMAYIFANGILLTPACALIIFANVMLYDIYLDAPVVISWMHALHDQQMGGVIMKIIQEIVYGSVLAYSFMKWYRRERREEDYPGDPNAPSASVAAAVPAVNLR